MFHIKFLDKVKSKMLCSITVFFRKSYRLRDNVEKYGTARQATDENTSWITKATNKHSEYVILIAFPRQQLLRERASMLRHTSIA
jgi:hypothetical protein